MALSQAVTGDTVAQSADCVTQETESVLLDQIIARHDAQLEVLNRYVIGVPGDEQAVGLPLMFERLYVRLDKDAESRLSLRSALDALGARSMPRVATGVFWLVVGISLGVIAVSSSINVLFRVGLLKGEVRSGEERQPVSGTGFPG